MIADIRPPTVKARCGPQLPPEITITFLLTDARPWTQASEPKPRDPCGACGRDVRAKGVACLHCLSVTREAQHRLDGARVKEQQADKQKRKPSAQSRLQAPAPPPKLTPRELRALKRYGKHPEAAEFLERQS